MKLKNYEDNYSDMLDNIKPSNRYIHTRVCVHTYVWASLLAQKVRSQAAKQDTLVQSLGRESPREWNGYPLWYSYLENSMDREAW